MTAQNGMLGEIKKNLERCGYSEPLLHSNYFYEDALGQHTVPLAGFASPVHDARTSCVSVITSEHSAQIKPENISKYRGLGAPVVFACCNDKIQWWAIRRETSEWKGTFTKNQLNDLFEKKKDDFNPGRLWRAKNVGRVHTNQQLEFVDIGLMPLLEDEMGERLGELMKRVISSLRKGFTEAQLKEASSQRWTFHAAFWLLCARILKDKGVKNFIKLNLTDIGAVIEAVTTHYGAQDILDVGTQRKILAFKDGAEEITKFTSLVNLTTEAFGCMYESLFVDKKLRSALGIHATPSYLVDYIVWQLWPWIKEIPEQKRIVLEPACGHAPFLTSAMRLLRELFVGDEKAFHKYAKRNIIGIEIDSFAREIARLSLTIADVPNSNGWKIIDSDIYRGDVLSNYAKNAAILLCNPPFEDFKPKEQNDLKEAGEQLKFYNKAAEMLWRTLPYMPKDSVFGVILPRGFLNKDNLSNLREMIIKDFEIQQICHLPKNVFRYANHESVVLSGRKKSTRRVRNVREENHIFYRHVPRDRLKEFQEKYATIDQFVSQSMFLEIPLFDLRLRELDDVWNYCERNCLVLSSVTRGGKGLEYKGKDLPEGAKTFDKKRFAGAVKGYVSFDSDIALNRLPTEYWMNLAPEVIRRQGWGLERGRVQILMNYAPVGSAPWRVKALIDREGRPVTSRFLVFRITSREWSLNALWAVLNSPLVNAYIYAHTTDRDIPAGTARQIPVPNCSRDNLEKIERLVEEYFNLIEKGDSQFGDDVRDTAKHILFSIDAEVMRLYNLPAKMEKRVLDLFQGVQRKGVDFEFKGYYPEGFESAIPLYEFLSEEYQRSTVSFVKKWVENNRSPEISKVFERALETFEGQ